MVLEGMAKKLLPLTDDEVGLYLRGKLEIEGDVYQRLFEHYGEEIPYGIAKARTGDPYAWIERRLQEEFAH